MIDVHMIPTPGWDIQFDKQVVRLAHPLVNVVTGVYIKGQILEARYQSFIKGSAPYVSWVDDDDVVLDMSWVDRAVTMLDDNPTIAAVYPRWRAVRERKGIHETTGEPFTPDKFRKATGLPDLHHLTVMRRQNVIATLETARQAHPNMTRSTERMLTIGQLRYGRLVALPELAYLWRLRDGSARTFREPPEIETWAKAHVEQSLACFIAE